MHDDLWERWPGACSSRARNNKMDVLYPEGNAHESVPEFDLDGGYCGEHDWDKHDPSLDMEKGEQVLPWGRRSVSSRPRGHAALSP